ncbi:MAG: guanylate kinase [Ruminococcus sp.]|jgi:guanylate kinase|nr:guanylate kinase [Ruminococcus sp.]
MSGKRGKLIVISGPSGCGKGTVIKKLAETTPFWLSVSDTTREIRAGETAGVNYNYLSNDEFMSKVNDGLMLEHASYSGRAGKITYYGTPKPPVLSRLEAGENVLLEIEVQGASQIKKALPEAVLIFIMPPSMEELEARLRGRGTEKPEDIKTRLETAKTEIALADSFDYTVVNDEVETCAERIKKIIEGDI